MHVALLGAMVSLSGFVGAVGQDPAGAQPPPVEVARPLFDAQDLALVRAERAAQEARDEVRRQLTDTVVNQERVVKAAELAWKKAILAREVCQFDVKDYNEGIYLQEVATAQSRITLAESDVKHTQSIIAAGERARAAGNKIDPRLDTVWNLELRRNEFDLEQAQTDLSVLQRYTQGKEIKRRTALVAEATAEEIIKKSEYDSKRGQLERRQNQAARLQALVPEDLVVALLDEVVAQETRVATLAREMGDLNGQVLKDPDQAARLVAQIAAKREAIRGLTGEIRASLLDATVIAEEARRARQRLFFAEKNLVQLRKDHDARPK